MTNTARKKKITINTHDSTCDKHLSPLQLVACDCNRSHLEGLFFPVRGPLVSFFPLFYHMRLGRKLWPKPLVWYSITRQVFSETRSGSNSASWLVSSGGIAKLNKSVKLLNMSGSNQHEWLQIFDWPRNWKMRRLSPSFLSLMFVSPLPGGQVHSILDLPPSAWALVPRHGQRGLLMIQAEALPFV